MIGKVDTEIKRGMGQRQARSRDAGQGMEMGADWRRWVRHWEEFCGNVGFGILAWLIGEVNTKRESRYVEDRAEIEIGSGDEGEIGIGEAWGCR